MTHNTDQLPQLIKMANQIAINQPVDILGKEVAIAAVAEHIKKYWAPPMRAKITNYVASDGSGLNVIAKQAVKVLP